MATHALDQADSAPAVLPRRAQRFRGKRATIIAAAKLVFFQEGYAGASMDRIKAEAGVSKATIYNHFRSKEELLLAVVDDVIVPYLAEYQAVLEHEQPFLDWLTATAITMVRKATAPETIALSRLMMAEALRFPELGRTYLHITIDSTLELYRPKFEQAVADGILRPGNVYRMMERFMESCATRPQRGFLYADPNPLTAEEIDDHARESVQFFLHGYATGR
ncbi:MAG TPA: TetR/AcrR family transcriptional regulator [Novosphingobium sp.]|nr:TetR/AcrR family transcriptional regulator [Novosphingobium sp.]